MDADDDMGGPPVPLEPNMEALLAGAGEQDAPPQDNANHNHSDNEDDDDDDEDEEDEMDEEDEVDSDNEQQQAANGDVIEGGVAEPQAEDAAVRTASQADITLFLQCTEALPQYPNHPILKPSVTVQIGLDKNTKLEAVFEKYVQVANGRSNSDLIAVSELEFVHSHVLRKHDTAEAAALMKNDTIRVRPERSAQRSMEQERLRLQRESDKDYFAQLRQLVHSSKYCDAVLDCQGDLMDDTGRVQRVLSTRVRCHSALLSHRCRWLREQFETARREEARRSIVSLPDVVEPPANHPADDHAAQGHVPVAAAAAESKDSDEEDIEVINYNAARGNNGAAVAADGDSHGAAQIENDDDDRSPKPHAKVEDTGIDNNNADDEPDDASSLAESARDADSHLLWVTLPNHPPEAVKLLLEYCYTNRVVALGLKAFMESCNPKPGRKHQGPVAPFSINLSSATRAWPNRGEPTVCFAVALAGLRLAEEACLPRLSLMCEVAAAQLVTQTNVVEALSLCEIQKGATGNDLSRLRKAAMDVVLRSGPRGVFSLPTFRLALEDRKTLLVPTLLTGVMEAVQDAESKHKKDPTVGNKREWREVAMDHFDNIDREDARYREKERRRRRRERGDTSEFDDNLKSVSGKGIKRHRTRHGDLLHAVRSARQEHAPHRGARKRKARRGSKINI